MDTTPTLESTEVAAIEAVVNGPEDEPLDWDAVGWRHVEQDVRRLRQRIFAASRAGDLKKVRNLQKLMLRSRSNALVAVRRVTELNAGRKTAGVDGKVVEAAEQKAELVDWMQHRAEPWSPRPVKRVYVPKSNGRRRPLGIPVIADRCLQALTVNALEPEWEARFEPKSYGFRPGRGCHDAIVAIHTTASRTDAKRLWVLDADLAAAFDHLNHDHICASLGTFPAVGLVRQWLEAGVIEDGGFLPTEEGAPQGGERSWAGSSTSTRRQPEAADQAPWPRSGTPHAGDALLDSYEAERRPAGTASVLRSLRRGPEPSAAGVVEDLGVRYPPGEQRAPHAWVRHAGRSVSTIDLFDARLTLLTGALVISGKLHPHPQVTDYQGRVPQPRLTERAIAHTEAQGAARATERSVCGEARSRVVFAHWATEAVRP